MSGKDANTTIELDKENADHVDDGPNVSLHWQLNDNNLVNTSIGRIPTGNSLVESSSCPSASIVDFCPPIWDRTMNPQNLGYSDMNAQNSAIGSSSLSHVSAGIGWNSNALLRGYMFLPSVPGLLPQSLPQFPADSGFIKRAARFSCFSGVSFSDVMNPFEIPGPLNPYSRELAVTPMPHEVMMSNMSNPQSGMQSRSHNINKTESSKDASLLKNEKDSENLPTSRDEQQQGLGMRVNASDEAEFSGRDPEELGGLGGKSSDKGFSSNKRKRSGQDTELTGQNGAQLSTETAKDQEEMQQKGDQTQTSTGKPGGKHGKQGTQASNPPKEEYMHVRARRGQATNSHSLAERVRREKISERMKFLQDLVPGCSKVTGKAVMLDEIINYVESLQRQVEFLSVKLATVNPCLDFNIEALLAKEILQSQPGPSSSLAFLPDMTVPYPIHPSQPILVGAGLPGLGSSSEALRKSLNPHLTTGLGGLIDVTSQVPSALDNELHSIIQMGFNSISPLNSQDMNGSQPLSDMKAEP